MGFKTGHQKPWTTEDVRELQEHSQARTPLAVIAKKMKRTEGALRRKAGNSRNWPRTPPQPKMAFASASGDREFSGLIGTFSLRIVPSLRRWERNKRAVVAFPLPARCSSPPSPSALLCPRWSPPARAFYLRTRELAIVHQAPLAGPTGIVDRTC